ncbi:hypothetical protein JM18_002361 [Phytophthora kernoviae]|uniref:Temptin Cys/Cys disulfide domain-containing protein n=1 Tax=Phytophthora kernoviae TaxID=325452 RepID=A0A8T0LY65_9STRA|nr:hypothetical protein JM16_002295 [Phytophthora kernoviae]KAG2525627.1 hypothetical protein JM18_002361 [Phytophthora kernoviae]
MKTCTAFAATALIVAATMDSAVGMKSYLEDLPNGSSFTQPLGHPDSDSSQFTKFGTAFGAVAHTWTPEFCKAMFPGSTMTNGAAFGDPCCTWTKGGKADFTVTAFTDTPGEATVCAAGGTPAAGGSTGGTPASSGSTGGTPATSTESSSTTDSSADSSADTSDTSTTPAPTTPTTGSTDFHVQIM